MPDPNTVRMDGVRIIFRNFRGEGDRFNKEGDRNFAVLLNDEVAATLAADGWNVKLLRPREDAEEGETPQPFLPVKLRYDIFPPKIAVVTGTKRKFLPESQVEMLDWVEIQNVDIIVRPYGWDINGKTGITAYVKTMYVTIEEDELDLKYDHLSD